jgi:hypothetical protein
MINGSEVPVPDANGIKTLEKLIKLEAQCYGQNPRNAMFSYSGIATTQDEARPLVNTGKRKFYVQSGARFSGRSVAGSAASAGVGSTVQGSAKGRAGS